MVPLSSTGLLQSCSCVALVTPEHDYRVIAVLLWSPYNIIPLLLQLYYAVVAVLQQCWGAAS